jgi:hypothetical protein
MRILHLGDPAVVPALRCLGHDVRAADELCPLLAVPGSPVDVRLVHREVAPDAELFFLVDVLGRHSLVSGVEDLPIPRLYWAVGVPIDVALASRFQLLLVPERAGVPLLQSEGLQARWLPWSTNPETMAGHMAVLTDWLSAGIPRRSAGNRAA